MARTAQWAEWADYLIFTANDALHHMTERLRHLRICDAPREDTEPVPRLPGEFLPLSCQRRRLLLVEDEFAQLPAPNGIMRALPAADLGIGQLCEPVKCLPQD